MRLGQAVSTKIVVAALGMLLLASGSAFGDATATVNATFVQDQAGVTPGTVTGIFTFNSTGVTTWDLTASASSNGNYGTQTFDSADSASAAPTFTLLANSNADQVLSFEENIGTQRDELDLVVACGGAADCLTGSTGSGSFTLVTGTACPSVGFCSYELFGVPETLNQRNLASGTITTAGATGGGGGNVPEPSSLIMLGPALMCLGLRRALKLFS